MGQSVEMCAIYKYGNDDALRVNVFFFFLSNSMPILAATIWWRMVLNTSRLALLLINYVFSHIFPSTFFVVVYFHASIFICVDIVMASLRNGILDIC